MQEVYLKKDLEVVYNYIMNEVLSGNKDLTIIREISNKYELPLYNFRAIRKVHNNLNIKQETELNLIDLNNIKKCKYILTYLVDIMKLIKDNTKDQEIFDYINVSAHSILGYKQLVISDRTITYIQVNTKNQSKTIKDNTIKLWQGQVNVYDNDINAIMSIIKAHKENICIGRAFGIINNIKNIRIERRKIKSKYTKVSRAGWCPCKSVLDFIKDNKIHINSQIKLNEDAYKPNSNSTEFYDFLHLIEFCEKISLYNSYKLLMKLLQVYEDYINKKVQIQLINNIFK